jgi:hypothetical protein
MHILVNLFVVAIVLGAGLLAYIGWVDWIERWRDTREGGWRSILMLCAIVSVAITALLFAAYAARNIAIHGDQGGDRITLACIRTGNYMSLAGILLSLGGRGRGRVTTLAGGCLMLFIWLSQGIGL